MDLGISSVAYSKAIEESLSNCSICVMFPNGPCKIQIKGGTAVGFLHTRYFQRIKKHKELIYIRINFNVKLFFLQ